MSSSNGFSHSLFALDSTVQRARMQSVEPFSAEVEEEQASEERNIESQAFDWDEAIGLDYDQDAEPDDVDSESFSQDVEADEVGMPADTAPAQVVPPDPLSHSNSLFALEQSVLNAGSSFPSLQFAVEDDEPEQPPIESQAFDWNEAIELRYRSRPRPHRYRSQPRSSWWEIVAGRAASPPKRVAQAQAFDWNEAIELEYQPIESQVFDWDEAIELEYDSSTDSTSSRAQSTAESFDWLPTEEHDYGFGLDYEPPTYEVEAFEVEDEPEVDQTEDEPDFNAAQALTHPEQPGIKPEPPDGAELPQPAQLPITNGSPNADNSPNLDASPKATESPKVAAPSPAEPPKLDASTSSPSESVDNNPPPEKPAAMVTPAPETTPTVEQHPAITSDRSPEKPAESVAPTPMQPDASDAIPVQVVVVESPQPPSQSTQPEALGFDQFDEEVNRDFASGSTDQASDAEAFAADIAAILRGEKVYEQSAESSPTPTPAPQPAQSASARPQTPSQAQSIPPKQPNGHDIFDQMRMSHATAFNLGTFSLEQTFDEFDAILDEQESAAFAYEDGEDKLEDLNTRNLDVDVSVLEKSLDEEDANSDERLSEAKTNSLSSVFGKKPLGTTKLEEEELTEADAILEGVYFSLKNKIFTDEYLQDFKKEVKTKPTALVKALTDFQKNKPSTPEECIEEVVGFNKEIDNYLRAVEDGDIDQIVSPVLKLLKSLNQLRKDLIIREGFLPNKESGKIRKDRIDAINKAGGALRETMSLAIFRRDHIVIGKSSHQPEEKDGEQAKERENALKEIAFFDQEGREFRIEVPEAKEAFNTLKTSLESLRNNPSLASKSLLENTKDLTEKLSALEALKGIKPDKIKNYFEMAVKAAEDLTYERNAPFVNKTFVAAQKKIKAKAVGDLSAEGVKAIDQGFKAYLALEVELSANLSIDVHAELAYKALLVTFKGHAEAWAGITKKLNADVRVSLQEISAQLGWNLEAAIKLNAHAEAYLKFGPLEIEASLNIEAFAGVRCAGDLTLKINKDGLKCGLQLDAFAGAEFGFKSDFGIKIGEKSFHELGIETKFLSGVGYTFEGEFNIEAGKIKIQFNAGAAFGLGLGLGLEFTIDPIALAKAIGDYIYKSYLLYKSEFLPRWQGYSKLLDFEEEVSAFNAVLTKFMEDKKETIKKTGASASFIGKKGRAKLLELYLNHANLIDRKSTSGKGDEQAQIKGELKDILWEVFLERFRDDDLLADLKEKDPKPGVEEYLRQLEEENLIPKESLEVWRKNKLIPSL